MVDLVVIALISTGLGIIAWAVDRNHDKYGAILPPAAAVVAAMLTWIITISATLGYLPGWTWVPWIASLLIGAAAAVAVTWLLGRSRKQQDTAQLTAILKHG
ncbi:hypothetical protein [Arthrobacter russicus]|uniref:Quaternary ammonium compound-resistance protein SugE n=1 Tax=Arthrobacter russicus TaxID=172040 RepID=A0ABU1J998_9MICC|nr:hypothetical protein [Arthrobacter russicus]MDN5668500.1 hypothetical protein [Renibacterium salmoninarum]MDR6268724.1 quaternary ammonium compound-resistance protein SugE [Arthrobacter russicus]